MPRAKGQTKAWTRQRHLSNVEICNLKMADHIPVIIEPALGQRHTGVYPGQTFCCLLCNKTMRGPSSLDKHFKSCPESIEYSDSLTVSNAALSRLSGHHSIQVRINLAISLFSAFFHFFRKFEFNCFFLTNWFFFKFVFF